MAPKEQTRAADKSVVVNGAGRQWMAGLEWMAYGAKPTLDVIRDDADKYSAEWVAYRNNAEVLQAGFGAALSEKRPRKLFSLGAAIAQAQEQPWLGVFELEPGVWWYLAIRDGKTIIPGGDVVGDHDEIMNARMQHANYKDWNFKEGNFNSDLLPVLKAAKGKAQLVPIKSVEPPSPVEKFGPAIGLVALVGVGAFAWHHHEIAVQREAAQRMAEARARLLLEQQEISPLKTTPNAIAWLQACRAVIEPLPISYSGWKLNNIVCGPSAVSVSWQRGLGATVSARPQGAVALDGNSIQSTIPLPHLPIGADDARGLVKSDEALTAILQRVGVQVRISAPPPPPRLPGAGAPTGRAVVTPSQQVAFKTPVAPWELDFGSVPGLRLGSLKLTTDGWDVTGALYGR